MLPDIIIQLFAKTPRRPVSVWSLLRGKTTASVLFAALEYDILQWRKLLPNCTRSDFMTVIDGFIKRGFMTGDASNVALTSAGISAQSAATARNPLPQQYQYASNAPVFGDRLFLGVQVVSEALAGNNRYVPVTSDWQVQRWVRAWYAQVHADLPAVATELTTAFGQLPDATADQLAAQLVGHDYNGQDVQFSALQNLAAISALAAIIAPQPDTYPLLTALWGGPRALVSANTLACVAQVERHVALADIARMMRRKLSTVNEYVQVYAILVRPLTPALFLTADQIATLQRAWAQGQRSYKELLAAVPESDFVPVRIFQIWQLRKGV